jgi:broad specificity phosphatase PhoE
MNIYLVRHGQTTGDVENRYGGDYDDHLTSLGQQQSKEVAKKLADKGIEVIYYSPLSRARETAAIIKSEIPMTLRVIPEFKERNRYGILTGLTKQESALKFPNQVELLADEQSTVEGAEDYKGFGQRIRGALEKIDTDRYEVVAVVTHGGPIRYIFREILKAGEIEIGDCAFARISSSNGTYKVHDLDGIVLKD